MRRPPPPHLQRPRALVAGLPVPAVAPGDIVMSGGLGVVPAAPVLLAGGPPATNPVVAPAIPPVVSRPRRGSRRGGSRGGRGGRGGARPQDTATDTAEEDASNPFV